MNRSENDMDNMLSQEQIEKYLAGKLSHEEAHKVEKQMLESEFEQEAMEGFEEVYPQGEFADDLTLLEKKIDDRGQKKASIIPLWVKIAAAISILVVSSVLILNIELNDLNNTELALEDSKTEQNEELPEVSGVEESVSTDSVGYNTIPVETKTEDLKPTSTESSKKEAVQDTESEPSNIVADISEAIALNTEGEAEIDEINEEDFDAEDIVLEEAVMSEVAGNSISLPKTHEVKGVIKSEENGESLAGVTVLLKGTDLGAITDLNGAFSFEIPKDKDTLLVSFIGLKPKEVIADPDKNLEIFMEDDFSALSEVVVVAEDRKKESRAKAARSEAFAQREISSASKKKSKRSREIQQMMQTRVLTGTVQSSIDSTSIPGVEILVEGTSTIVQTDSTGKFSVEIPDDPRTTLAFVASGMEKQEIEVGDEVDLTLQLAPDTIKQSDIVYVDYERNKAGLNKLLTRAQPVGGNTELNEYIAQNMRNSSSSKNLEGRVIIEFTILPNGELTDFNVIQGIDKARNQEAQRLIKEGPNWLPASLNGQPRKDKVRVRIKFDK